MWFSLKTFLVAGALIVASQSYATTYYVDQSHSGANDANPGTETSPWRTIQKAANTLVAGDTVLVKKGTYTELSSQGPDSDIPALKPQNSGTAGKYITYQAFPGDRVVIDQQRGGCGFIIGGKHYIKIIGFEIKNTYSAGGGVWTKSGSSNIIVDGNYIHNLDGPGGSNVAGIRFDSVVQATARNNHIHTIRVAGVNNGNASGITSYGMENVVIENNEMYDANNGIYHKMSSGGIGALIRRNIIHDTDRGIFYDVAGGGSPPHINQRVTENILYNNTHAIIMEASDANGVNDGFYVWNNVIQVVETAITIFNTKNIEVYNNVFVGRPIRKTIRLLPTVSNVNFFDFNDYVSGADDYVVNMWAANEASYTSLSAWQSGTNYDPNGMTASPSFVDELNHNYKLNSNSPLKGAGRNGEDIGAYPTGTEVIGIMATSSNPQPGTYALRPKQPTGLVVY